MGSLPAALVVYTGHWLGELGGLFGTQYPWKLCVTPGSCVPQASGEALKAVIACPQKGTREHREGGAASIPGVGTGVRPRPAAFPEPTGAIGATSSTKQPSAPWGPLRVSVTQTIWAWGGSSETLLNSPPSGRGENGSFRGQGAGGRVKARSLVGCRQSAANPPSSQKGATCHR